MELQITKLGTLKVLRMERRMEGWSGPSTRPAFAKVTQVAFAKVMQVKGDKATIRTQQYIQLNTATVEPKWD